MPVMELVHFCLGCKEILSEEEYRKRPTRMVPGGSKNFPVCVCGNIWFLHEEKEENEEDDEE